LAEVIGITFSDKRHHAPGSIGGFRASADPTEHLRYTPAVSLPEQLLVLRDVVGRLELAEISYMVTGSVAMNYYAEPRMTRDIDFVVAMDAKSIPRFLRAFEHDFHLSESSVEAAVRDRTLFSSIHMDQVVKLDFVVRQDTAYREQEFARRRRISVGGIDVFLVSSEDLLLSKLHRVKQSGSELQLRDARNLIRSGAGLDWKYLGHWADELSVSAMLEQLR
jgi:hypothetical protein